MSALSREELVTACAKLYDMSRDNFILPPLTRGAAENTETSLTYLCLSDDIRLKFSVIFDHDYAQLHNFPLPKLPLKFKLQICDRDLNDLPIKLDETERRALIYAFLLGVKAPIGLEEEEGAEYTLSLQLSSTFSVRWRQALEIGANATADDICREVGSSLYERSQDFFMSRADGVAIWSVRAAQELLGAAQPSAEALFRSCVDPASLSPSSAADSQARARSAEGSGALVCAGAALPEMITRAGSLALRRERRMGYTLVAAMLLAGTIGSLQGAGLPTDALPGATNAQGPVVAPPPQNAALSPTANPAAQETIEEPEPVMMPMTGFAVEEKPPRATSSAPLATDAASLVDAPAAMDVAAAATSQFAGVVPSMEPTPIPPVRRPQPIRKPPKSEGVAKAAAQPPAETENPVKTIRPNAKRSDNPLVLVGQAIGHLATHIAKGLQSIPDRL
jgi:hypothetical protein